jgi:hypothetical protein
MQDQTTTYKHFTIHDAVRPDKKRRHKGKFANIFDEFLPSNTAHAWRPLEEGFAHAQRLRK